MTTKAKHLLDLPPELLDEIIKRCDLYSIKQLSNTCTYLKERIQHFREVHKDIIAEKLPQVYLDDETDEDDYDDSLEYNYDDEHDTDERYLQDMMDRISWGSNLDEDDPDELIHGS